MRKGHPRAVPAAALVCIAILVAWIAGCAYFAVPAQERKMAGLAEIFGTVTAEHETESLLVVVLVRLEGGLESDEISIVDHFVVRGGGRFYFLVTPGAYAVGAFEDRSGDLVYRDEPLLRPVEGPRFELGVGAVREGVELVIPTAGRFPDYESPISVRELQARTEHDQTRFTLGQLAVAGDVVDISEPRFGPKSGSLGHWKPFDFMLDVGPGVYFAEEYDPDRIPVLFVHGISGHPQNFSTLSERIDREHFQPWYFFYPSGVRLQESAELLSRLMAELYARLRFDEVVVVAHSMGGLVARAFILFHHDTKDQGFVRLFVSISTPWGGNDAARTGVDRSPVVVRSWRDVAAGSDFIEGIFFEAPGEPRRLPEHVPFHLLFGFRRNARVPGPSGDGVIVQASSLRLEAQEEALSVRGFDQDHVKILESERVAARLGEIMEARFD